jgi:Domain of Unknown Function (DUF1080)
MAFHSFLRSIAAGIFIACGSFAIAEEKKPNTLTKEEIADGWILLFDGETTFGWTGKAEVKEGKMHIAKGEKMAFNVPLPLGELLCEFEGVDLKLFTSNIIEVLGGIRPPSLGTFLWKRSRTGQIIHNQWSLTLDGKNGDSGLTDETSETDAGILKFDTFFSKGSIRFVKFRPASPEKLFNGKDLTGWKVFKDEKRAKSEWSVTPAGELALKNGPGDLQTEKQYDNFLLQLECKTNGPALNSGIFFRCLADQYQNGYEMQIHNAYKEGDRTKPADFGTGAIYRRIPARKVVSDDQEWFSMTLLAHGPHIATWVNGYPVVSWKDERPADENPRKGLKTGKGHLSIQGHDPTTDILFRNIRIVELK